MLYLLDANVLITAHNLYYPIDSFRSFGLGLSTRAAAATSRYRSKTTKR